MGNGIWGILLTAWIVSFAASGTASGDEPEGGWQPLLRIAKEIKGDKVNDPWDICGFEGGVDKLGTLISMRMICADGGQKPVPVEKAMTPKGAPLKEAGGCVVSALRIFPASDKARAFHPSQGGPAQVIYTKNCVTGSSSTIDLNVLQTAGKWEIRDANMNRVNCLTIVPGRFLGKDIGIGKINMSYKPECDVPVRRPKNP